MNTASVAAAQKYGQRGAFDLIAFREVGLPLYRLNTTAIVMVEKAIPAMEELVLRAIDAEMDTVKLASHFSAWRNRISTTPSSPSSAAVQIHLQLRP